MSTSQARIVHLPTGIEGPDVACFGTDPRAIAGGRR